MTLLVRVWRTGEKWLGLTISWPGAQERAGGALAIGSRVRRRARGIDAREDAFENVATMFPIMNETRSSFDAALMLLVPSRNRKATMALFGNRRRWRTIQQWRLGYRNPPAWAWDVLQSRLEAYAKTHADLRSAKQKSRPVKIGS